MQETPREACMWEELTDVLRGLAQKSQLEMVFEFAALPHRALISWPGLQITLKEMQLTSARHAQSKER